MSERKIFRLRCPNGKHAGAYLVGADFDTGVHWALNAEQAPSFSLVEAYSYVAGLIDQCCECVVPESCGATEEECREFGRRAANDMLNDPKPSTVERFETLAVRRSPDEPLCQLPSDFPKRTEPGYMSVFEWMARAFMRQEPQPA